MRKQKVLMIHPALPPYRVDFFNSISEIADFELFLLRDNLRGQKFDQRQLLSKLNFVPTYPERKITVFHRVIPLDIISRLRRAKPDIVIVTEYSFSTALAVLYRAFSPTFRLVLLTDDNQDSAPSDFLRRFARLVLTPHVDGWIFISDTARDFFLGPDERRSAAVMPIIHKEKAFREGLLQGDATTVELIERHQLAGRRVLLFVGRLVEDKRLDLAIEAFAKAAPSIPDAVFVVVGAGVLLEELQAAAERSGVADRVYFVGRQEGAELAAWYRIGQLLALFSTWEPYGAVVNEALLAGMPVLVSRVAGSTDLVAEGKNGSVIDPFDIEKNAEMITRWLNQTPPVSNTAPIRPNLMVKTFDQGIQQIRALFEKLRVKSL